MRIGHGYLFGPAGGYVLRLTAEGVWSLLVGDRSTVLATGSAGSPRGVWRELRLTMMGSVVSASIDGVEVGRGTDSTWANGLAGVASGFHNASFRAFHVEAAKQQMLASTHFKSDDSSATGEGEGGLAPLRPRFSNVFQSHMVLQRNAPVKIWGFAASGGPHLVVALCKQGNCITRTVALAVDGSWSTTFPSQKGSTTPFSLTVGEEGGKKSDANKLQDIVFGDVLLFSGQSNIETTQPYAFSKYNPHAAHCSKGWPWAKPNDPTMCSTLNVTLQNVEEEFADTMGGAKGLIRLMVVPNQVHGLNYTATPAKELADVPDAPLCKPTQVDPFVECVTNSLRWTRANATTIRGFSGVGWFTGAAVLKAAIAAKSADQSVPLGLLRSSWGGTRVEEWSSPAAIAACPAQTGAEPPHGGNGVSTLWANMIMPFRGMSFRAYTFYRE
jgi:hypothetical protein